MEVVKKAENVDFAFTISRNPYERCLSLWWSTCMQPHDKYGLKQHGETPAKLVKYLCSQSVGTTGHVIDLLQTQSEIFYDRCKSLPKEIDIDSIIKIKYSNQMSSEIRSQIPALRDMPDLPRLNEKKNGRPPSDYSSDYINAVNEWCPNDFKLFGYPMLQIKNKI